MPKLSEAKLRELVSQYDWPVDKVLYVIRGDGQNSYGESNGNTDAVGDGGHSIGLFQSQYIPAGSSAEQQVADAYRLYKADLSNGGTGFGDWGEGRLYQGKPFGALGNHPYPGGKGPAGLTPIPNYNGSGLMATPIPNDTGTGKLLPVNGKAPADVQPVSSLAKVLYQLTQGLNGGLLSVKQPGQIASQPLKPVSSLPTTTPTTGRTYAGYQPTGSYKDDTIGYFSQMQVAQQQLQKYIQNAPYAINVDEDTGLAYKLAADGQSWEPDVEASKLYQQYHNASQNLDQLYAAKKAGIVDSGEDAASAYLASEKEKAAEASRQYDDFIKRIGDLVSLENVPISRAQTLASTLSTITDQKQKRQQTYGQYATLPDGQQYQDLTAQKNSLAASIPQTAPSPYGISADALKPRPSAGTSVPVPKPEEVLARYGITLPPGMSTGIAAPGGVSPHDVSPAGTGTPPVEVIQTQPRGNYNVAPGTGAGPNQDQAYGSYHDEDLLDKIITGIAGLIPNIDTTSRKRVPAKTYGGG